MGISLGSCWSYDKNDALNLLVCFLMHILILCNSEVYWKNIPLVNTSHYSRSTEHQMNCDGSSFRFYNLLCLNIFSIFLVEQIYALVLNYTQL